MSKYSLLAKVGADTTQYKKAMANMKKTNNKMMGSFKSMAGTIGLAFGVSELLSFGQELHKIGSQAKGVRDAFDNLNEPGLLNSMRKATIGTVDDLKLMQNAVKAQNFKIPLDQLATYFEFATKRAKQTGESVDYLVDSLITGLGRKSVLVMDNLGISAIELQEEVKKVGNFGLASGNIIQRELGKMADLDESILAAEQLGTKWENFKILMGEEVAPAINEALTELMDINDEIGSSFEDINLGGDGTGILAKYLRLATIVPVETLKAVGSLGSWGSSVVDWFSGVSESIDDTGQSADDFNNKVGGLLNNTSEEVTKIFIDQRSEYQKLTDGIAALESSFNEAWSTDEIINYNTKLKKLKDRLSEINTMVFRVNEGGITGLNKKEATNITGHSYGGRQSGDIQKTADKFIIPIDMEATKAMVDQYETEADRIEQINQRLSDTMKAMMGDMAISAAEGLGAMIAGVASGGDVMINLIKQFLGFMGQIGGMMVQLALAEMAFFAALLSNPVAALAIGLGLVALSSALKGMLSKGPGDGPPALAQGGLAYGPTLAMVGDNAGARSDPEVIAPLSKLNNLTGGATNVSGTFKVRGQDLWVVLEKYKGRIGM